MREVKPIQPEKHSRPNDVTEDGMVREVKPVQPEKQLSPNEVTLEGMVMEIKPIQPLYLLLVDYQYFTP